MNTNTVTPKRHMKLAAIFMSLALVGAYYVTTPPVTSIQAASPVSADGEHTVEQIQALILNEVNNARTQYSRPPVKLSPRMNLVAQSWSNQQAAEKRMYHNPNYSKQVPSGWSWVGENVAAGQSAENVVSGWMNSPGHRDNILKYGATDMGIAVAVDSYGTLYYTQLFAQYPQTPVTPTPTPTDPGTVITNPEPPTPTPTPPPVVTPTPTTKNVTTSKTVSTLTSSASTKSRSTFTAVKTQKRNSALKSVTTYKVNANVSLRSKPSSSGKWLITVPKNSNVGGSKGSSNGWMKVTFKGKTGYVPVKNLTKVVTYNTTTAITLRTKTSHSSTKIMSIPKGANIGSSKGTSGDWMKVTYKRKTGYVPQVYHTTVTTYKVNTGVAVYSKAAYTGSKKLINIPINTNIGQSLGTSGNWMKVTYKGKTGYIPKTYNQPITIYKTAGAVNMYSTAGTTGTKYFTIPSKTAVGESLGTSGNWMKVTYKGKTGYIPKTSTTSTTTLVTVKAVKFTTLASPTATVLHTIPANTNVGVSQGTSGNYIKITYNGKTGYIPKTN